MPMCLGGRSRRPTAYRCPRSVTPCALRLQPTHLWAVWARSGIHKGPCGTPLQARGQTTPKYWRVPLPHLEVCRRASLRVPGHQEAILGDVGLGAVHADGLVGVHADQHAVLDLRSHRQQQACSGAAGTPRHKERGAACCSMRSAVTAAGMRPGPAPESPSCRWPLPRIGPRWHQ